MAKEKTLDRIDYQLLGLLQRNSRASVEELARAVGLTKTPVTLRIRAMEKSGIILGYTARLDSSKLGYAITAFTAVTLNQFSTRVQRYSQAILAIPEVMECHHVTGPYDLMLKVRVTSMLEYESLIVKKLSGLAGIERLTTVAFVLSTGKEETFSLPETFENEKPVHRRDAGTPAKKIARKRK